MTSNQYSQVNQLLAEFSQLSASFEAAEAGIKKVQLDAARALLPEHAELKIKLTKIEEDLRKLADAHYGELFPEEKRSHQTPFGGLKYQKSTSLEFDDMEKVLLKIELECERELKRAAMSQAAGPMGTAPRFTTEQLIRTHKEPNLLAMESFDDATLALFGVMRVHKDNFSVVPFKMKSDKPASKSKLQEAA